jgi:hypothetical protein
MESQKQFLETLNIYRGKAALQISPSPHVGLIFLNLAQAIPGMESKLPAKAQKKYQWDKKLTVSFNFDGALEVAATAHALMEGKEELVTDAQGNLPSWYRDPKKAGRQGNAKTLGFYRAKNQPKGLKATYYLGIVENTKDKQGNKVGIPLDHSDLFKIASVMQEAALALLGWRKDIEQLKETNGHGEAEKEPLQRSPDGSRGSDSGHDPAAPDEKQPPKKEEIKEDDEIF